MSTNYIDFFIKNFSPRGKAMILANGRQRVCCKWPSISLFLRLCIE